MRLRNWLLTGTSVGLLAFASLGPAIAQDVSDPALVAAFEAYKADPNDANQQALTEACIVAGFATLDECIAALTNAAVVSEEAPPPAEEAPPPAAEETAPPAEEAPPPAEEAPPPAASEEAPPPAAEEAPPTPPAEEAAPPSSSEEMAPPPAEEQAPPPADSNADVLVQLQAAVALYNEGVAELDAGNADGQLKVDQANAQIEAICSAAGFPDAASCLASFGLELSPLPEMPPPATSEEPPAASEPVDENAVEVLPPDVPAEEAAPILDSQKDEQTLEDEGQQTEEQAPPPPSEPPPPPPTDDQQAQAQIQPPPPEDQSTQTEQGTQIDVGDITLTPMPPPEAPNVVVVPNQPTNSNGGLVVEINFQLVIINYYQDRDRYYNENEDEIYYEQLSRGRIRETVIRPNGVKIVTIRDRHGEVLKRSKILPNGTEIILASYDRSDDEDVNLIWTDPGDELPPLRLTISAGDYILDAEDADEDQIELFLDEPPVEQVKRIYSIEEVKRSARIRDMVRRLEVGNLTFDTGSAQIQQDQVGALSKVAKAMQKLLERNPAEVFLIEGHTDAVGSDVSNLALSDLRAATVADILTEFYDIPAENLVTQGYGERYLKVKTEAAEELNRRVTFKRVTPLISYSN